MDQFSHDLTLALEETSLMDRASGVGRGWGARRRTRSTGNLPCAPQPTEDSSSSPTDQAIRHAPNETILPTATLAATASAAAAASDSDDKAAAMLPLLRLPGKTTAAAQHLKSAAAARMGIVVALESDSLNETNFSPARFYKPNSRRRRKIKRMSMEFELSKDFHDTSQLQLAMPMHVSGVVPGVSIGTNTMPANTTGTLRKRLLKTGAAASGGGAVAAAAGDSGAHRSNLIFCGKRKRNNRFYDQEQHQCDRQSADAANDDASSSELHSSSMPRYTHIEEYQRMRPRSYSSTSKPHSDCLLPLNQGLLSKIDRIAQTQQKTDNTTKTTTTLTDAALREKQQQQHPSLDAVQLQLELNASSHKLPDNIPEMETFGELEKLLAAPESLPLESPPVPDYHGHRQKLQHSKSRRSRRRYCQQTPQPQLQLQSMDCSDLYDFLSSSSLSSSSDDSEDNHRRRHDTDREGDDELTDWPGSEVGAAAAKYDAKRKLTKKSLLPQLRSDENIGCEDDTLMSGAEATVDIGVNTSTSPILPDALQDFSRHFQPSNYSEPIEILSSNRVNRSAGFLDVNICLDVDTRNLNGGLMPCKQIESEMSGETSNPFLSSSSPPLQLTEVREIRAGCRRINGDRPGFTIKLGVNERLARFLQDPHQTKIRLPDIEISEHDSLLNLATLYSLNMIVEHGCTVLTKTRNTTQSVNIDGQQRNMEQGEQQDLYNDFKRRCYEGHCAAGGEGGGDAATTTTAASATATATVTTADADLMLPEI